MYISVRLSSEAPTAVTRHREDTIKPTLLPGREINLRACTQHYNNPEGIQPVQG